MGASIVSSLRPPPKEKDEEEMDSFDAAAVKSVCIRADE